MTPTPLLTPRQVAEILGVHPQTVARWAREGHLKCVLTPGRHRRFQQSDVDDFVRAGAQPLHNGDAA